MELDDDFERPMCAFNCFSSIYEINMNNNMNNKKCQERMEKRNKKIKKGKAKNKKIKDPA